MRGFLSVYSKILHGITAVVGVIAGLLLFIPVFSVFYEVVSRGLFNKPTEWAIEMSTYCVLMAGFLGLGVALAAGRHIHVDIVLARLGPRTNDVRHVIVTLIGVVFTAVFFVTSAQMAWMSYDLDMVAASTLRMPLWIPQASMPVGIGLLFLQFVRLFLESLVRLSDPAFDPEAAGKGAAK